jgi:hypothetical protein
MTAWDLVTWLAIAVLGVSVLVISIALFRDFRTAAGGK